MRPNPFPTMRPLRQAEHRPPPPPPELPKRKVIQIAVTAGEKAEGELFALCDDGTMWMLNYGGQWHQMPAIPQAVVKPMQCEAKQYSDQMHCRRCDQAWDMNDPNPPACSNR